MPRGAPTHAAMEYRKQPLLINRIKSEEHQSAHRRVSLVTVIAGVVSLESDSEILTCYDVPACACS